MSTRSKIGISNPEDGTVFGIYCHFDGYPDGVGKTLKRHYKSEAKVRELIALGDLSSLGKEIGEKHDINNLDNVTTMCRAYGRDRGEPDTEARAYANLQAFLDADLGQEYTYLFRNGKWEQGPHP